MRCPNCSYELNNTKQRSNPENRYFHGVILPVLAQTEAFGGWSKDEIKEFLKEKFLSITKTMKIGNEMVDVQVVSSSAWLSTVAWEKWMSDIRQWASLEIGVYINEPNEASDENI